MGARGINTPPFLLSSAWMAGGPGVCRRRSGGFDVQVALMYRLAAMPTTFAKLLALPPGAVSGLPGGNAFGDAKCFRCVHPITV